MRGGLETLLALQQCGDMTKEDTWWQLAFAALSTASALDLALSLQFNFISPSLLSFAGTALPALTRLTVGAPNQSTGDCEIQLPPPKRLGALRDLTVKVWTQGTESVLWRSVAPYMAQLTSLTVAEPSWLDHRPVLEDFFSHVTTASTLKRLSLPCVLDPWLCHLLQKHTPVLDELTVECVSTSINDQDNHEPNTADVIASVCSWTVVRVTDQQELHELAWHPEPASGAKLVVQPTATAIVDLCLRYTKEATQVFSRFDVRPGCGTIRVLNADPDTRDLGSQLTPVPPASEPSALRGALTLLRPLLTPQSELQVVGFSVSEPLACELAPLAVTAKGGLSLLRTEWPAGVALSTRLPPLRSRGLRYATAGGVDGAKRGDVTDQLRGQMAQGLSRVGTLLLGQAHQSVDTCLETPVPQGMVLPWARVKQSGTVELDAWLRQAELMDVTWELDTCNISLSLKQVDSGEYLHIADRVRVLPIQRVEIVRIWPDYTLQGGTAEGLTEQLRVLCASLVVARAFECGAQVLDIRDRWPAWNPVVDKLIDKLPHWHGELQLRLKKHYSSSTRDWPVTRLLTGMPRTYRKLVMHGHLLHAEELHAFLLSAPQDRAESEPLTITIRENGRPWVKEQVKQTQAVMSAQSYPHITVRSVDRY